MLKRNFRTHISFCIFALVAFFSLPAASDEINGKTASGQNFVVEVSGVAKPLNSDGIWGVMKLIYKSHGKVTQENYSLSIQAPATVTKNRFGLVIISEKSGGMNGVYRVTYLYPSNDGLTTIGAVELGMDNGKYTEVSQIIPKWIRQVGATDRPRITQSISVGFENMANSHQNLSIDDALLLFAMPELVPVIRKRTPAFPVAYSNYISNEIDASMANLIRREFVGDQTSLCDIDQFDVFACSLGKRTISVCSGSEDGANILQYRAGYHRKLELLMTKK